jgi:hypothetical protein
VLEPLLCPTCSSPAQPDQTFCGKCGAPLPNSAPSEATDASVDEAGIAALGAGTSTDPRLAALGLAAPEPDFASQALGAAAPNVFAPPATAQFAPPSAPKPDNDGPERVPGGYLEPSSAPSAVPSQWTLKPSSTSSAARPAGPSMSVAVGAIPISSLGMEEPDGSDLPAEPATADWTAGPAAPTGSPASPKTPPAAFAPRPAVASPFAAPSASRLGAASMVPAPPVARLEASAPSPASDESARKESTLELVAFGLVAAGAVVGLAGLLLPWATADGIGIGNVQNAQPQANQWGLSMPAGILLFLLSGLVLGAASGSDRAKERLPNLAAIIGQVTDLIMPMVLGGLYLGVFLLYLTYPWGFGLGVLSMLLGGGLLIAGAIVTLFCPPEVAPDPK